jgi:hypothetical protein
MSLTEPADAIKTFRLYARLASVRAELHLIRSQVENGRDGPRAKLLDQRFDAVQARAADIHARMIESRAV